MSLLNDLIKECAQLHSKLAAARKTATTLYTNPNFRLIGLQLFNDLGEIPPNLEDKY